MLLTVIIPTIRNINKIVVNILQTNFYDNGDVEFIIVDDQHSNYKIKSKVKLLPLVKILKTKIPFSGPGSARNVGIRNATGKFITFLDDDDELILDRNLFKQLKTKNADLFIGNFLHPNESYSRNILKKDVKINNIRSYLGNLNKKNIFINHCLGIVIRNKKPLNFAETFIVEDITFITKLLLSSKKIFFTDSICYKYSMNNSSTKNLTKLSNINDVIICLNYLDHISQLQGNLFTYWNRTNDFLFKLLVIRLFSINNIFSFIKLFYFFVIFNGYKNYLKYFYTLFNGVKFYIIFKNNLLRITNDSEKLFVFYCDGAITNLIKEKIICKYDNSWVVDDRFLDVDGKSNFFYLNEFLNTNYAKKYKSVCFLISNLDLNTTKRIKKFINVNQNFNIPYNIISLVKL